MNNVILVGMPYSIGSDKYNSDKDNDFFYDDFAVNEPC